MFYMSHYNNMRSFSLLALIRYQKNNKMKYTLSFLFGWLVGWLVGWFLNVLVSYIADGYQD